jgi:hypothetical protein
MLRDFLFEIQCAEEIGAHRIADALDAKLLRLATSDHKTLKKQIEKKYSNNKDIKSIDYSPGQHKFIISADSSLPNNIKRDIKSIVEPYSLSFKYSMKNIDELMGEGEDLLHRHIKNLLAELYNKEREPSDAELKLEEEFPADDISDDPYSLDQLLLAEALKNIRKKLKNIRKKLD